MHIIINNKYATITRVNNHKYLMCVKHPKLTEKLLEFDCFDSVNGAYEFLMVLIEEKILEGFEV